MANGTKTDLKMSNREKMQRVACRMNRKRIERNIVSVHT